jgi:hypothetical protein
MFQKSAGGCRCYWGVAMSQPTWVSRAGHGPATDAGSGAWAGCGHGTWGRMRARELHRCGSRLRTSRLGLPFTLSSNRSRGGCVFSRFVSISIVHSACNDNDINGKSTFCHLCSKSLLSFEKWYVCSEFWWNSIIIEDTWFIRATPGASISFYFCIAIWRGCPQPVRWYLLCQASWHDLLHYSGLGFIDGTLLSWLSMGYGFYILLEFFVHSSLASNLSCLSLIPFGRRFDYHCHG